MNHSTITANCEDYSLDLPHVAEEKPFHARKKSRKTVIDHPSNPVLHAISQHYEEHINKGKNKNIPKLNMDGDKKNLFKVISSIIETAAHNCSSNTPVFNADKLIQKSRKRMGEGMLIRKRG